MNQPQFVQVPCVKCKTIVWISPAAGVGYCPSCQTPNPLPASEAAAPGAAPGAPGAPAQPGMSPMMSFGKGPAAFAGGGVSKTKIYGGIALAVLVAGGGSVARGLLPKPGIVSVSSLGIDNKKADPDKMLAAAVPYAKKWKGDAVFWSMTVQKLRADGTTDLSDTNVNIEFVSPSGVSSFIGSQRDDSIKKFNFIDGKMQFKDKWGVRERASSAPHGMPIPGCTAKKLAEKLVSMKIMKPEGVQATIDPHFSEGWLVQTGSIPKKFDIMTCAELK